MHRVTWLLALPAILSGCGVQAPPVDIGQSQPQEQVRDHGQTRSSKGTADATLSSRARSGDERVISGTVVSIADGDTLTVLDATKTQHKVRLQGIDAPERRQAFGTRSREALGEKVFQKAAHVEWSEKDRYGRVLGQVYLDDRWINREMAEEGWAWHYRQYSDDEELAAAEAAAREAKRGLWADPHPVPPWEFRRNPRPETEAAPEEAAEREPPPAGRAGTDETVYVTRTGGKYHRATCRHVRGGGTAITLSEARMRYSPCSVCDPPK